MKTLLTLAFVTALATPAFAVSDKKPPPPPVKPPVVIEVVDNSRGGVIVDVPCHPYIGNWTTAPKETCIILQ